MTLLEEARALLMKDPEAALSTANRLPSDRQNAAILRVVADAHRRLGNLDQAATSELMAIQASVAEPALERAAKALEEGRTAEAATIVANYLERDPEDLLALTILSEALIASRKLTHAEEAARHVIERAPGFTRGHIVLGRSLLLQCRVREACALLESFIRQQPGNRQALGLYARVLTDSRQFDRAAACCEQLLADHQPNPGLWINYGLVLMFLGRVGDAEAAFRKSLDINPSNGAAWWALASMTPQSIRREDVAAIGSALERHRGETDNQSQLQFALGSILDRAGNYEKAFPHFALGNRIASESKAYDPRSLTREVDHSVATFNSDFYGKREQWGAPDQSPIFIIGMPRTGSTVIERVLGGHSEIEAVGELPVIPSIVDQLDAEAGQVGGYRDLLARMSEDRVRSLGELYLDLSRQFRFTNKPFFTDKLHINWRHLDLIRLILPKARIIDMRRNPIDCCWSNYRRYFAQGHPASNDLTHIALFYRDYRRAMDHFSTQTSSCYLAVDYEKMVDDLETEGRRTFAFLDIQFERTTLDFHLSGEPVSTASAEQVRHPLNRSGIGAWENYRPWLAELLESLGSFATAATGDV